MSGLVVQLRAVRKTFTTAAGPLSVLRDVALDVDAGESCAVVGRSGSGKSTLLNVLGLLDRPDAGSYAFLGEPMEEAPERRRAAVRSRGIGYVFQSFHLLPRRSVLWNVLAPALFRDGGRRWRAERSRAVDLLEEVGLGDKAASPVERLSGGEQQRVAIARALLARPALLLADEPSGSLDVETGEAVVRLLLEQARHHDTAVVVVTHDPVVAGRCDRRLRLDDGVLLEEPVVVPQDVA